MGSGGDGVDELSWRAGGELSLLGWVNWAASEGATVVEACLL